MSAPPHNTPSPLNIRVKQEQRDLIEQAAEVSDMTVSNFVRDAALRAAEDAILDQTIFQLDAQTWKEFIDALDAPPLPNPRLHDLVSRPAPWDE